MKEVRRADRCCIVRPEARAREFVVVARLILLREQSKRKRRHAAALCSQVPRMKMRKSQTQDLKRCDLRLDKMKSLFREMEVFNRCSSNCSGDLGVGVIRQSNTVIAGSFRINSKVSLG